LVLNRYGKGKVIYAAMPFEANKAYGAIVARVLRFLAGDAFTFEADAPKAVEVTAFEQKSRKRFLINLVNFQEELPNIPVYRAKVTVRVDRRKVRRVVILPEARRIVFHTKGDTVTFTIPRLDTFAMVAVEYK